MDGPVVEESSDLYDLTLAFRKSVQLALTRSDGFPMVEYEVYNVPLSEPPTTAYSLSPFENQARENFENENSAALLDQEIEKILEEAELNSSKRIIQMHGTRFRFQMLKSKLSRAFSRALVIPAHRTVLYTSNFPRTLLKLAVSRQRTRCCDGDVESDESDNFTDATAALETDFWISLKTTLQIDGCQSSESSDSPRIATASAFAPDCFADLRKFFGITETFFAKSIFESGPYVSFQSNSKGAARAGLVFFFTRDGAYMIKTIKRDEVDTLLEMLPKYYRYMQRNGERSLLTRFCGMYDVRFEDTPDQSYTFVVMNSVFPAEANRLLTERYDLKGSSIGRECSMAERVSKGPKAVLKDLDLKREVDVIKALPSTPYQQRNPDYGIHIGAPAKSNLMRQLRKDVQLLVACGVIDYSLLVGVSKDDPGLDTALLHVLDESLYLEERIRAGQTPNNTCTQLISSALAPLQTLMAPPVFVARKSLLMAKKLFSSPKPYYGSGTCVVDSGPLSIQQGSRSGVPATYYFGLIDFLQPYNSKKALEYRLKGLVYARDSYSCVPPQLYADRFLAFLNEHIT